jgi:hypothetical protein
MRERGKYQIQCMKSRSSTGVGMKIDLDYSIETMRITDPGISDSGDSGYKSTASAVMDRIKSASTVAEKTDAAPVRGVEVESSKLRTMLSGLKSQQV